MADQAKLSRLAYTLPDIPRWVETRKMLLSGDCEVFGLNGEHESWFVVRKAGQNPVYASIVGYPPQEDIVEAIGRGREEVEVLAFPENRSYVAAALQDWSSVTATLHTLGDAHRLPDVPEGSTRLLSSPEMVDTRFLPPDLQSELRDAVETSPIAAAFADEHPASFCYAGAQTENLWDVSIDTLESFRNQGYAAQSVAFMIGHLRLMGKQPVWCAEETNKASSGLAAKLGFVPVDELVVLRPPVGIG